MKAAIYIIILIGLGLVIYDAWFSNSRNPEHAVRFTKTAQKILKSPAWY